MEVRAGLQNYSARKTLSIRTSHDGSPHRTCDTEVASKAPSSALPFFIYQFCITNFLDESYALVDNQAMRRGKFIVIDGIDGSGKGTEIRLLKKAFAGTGTIFTREPGATQRAQEIRNILLERSKKDSSVSDSFLFWAARVMHVEEVIKPALSAGKNVISDRFDSSTFAYQVIADKHPELRPLFSECRKVVLRKCVPDAYIFLDLPVSVSMKRIKGDSTKRNKYDVKPEGYHKMVRQGFKKFASATRSKVFIVDASPSPEGVHKEVLGIVKKLLR